VNVKHIAAVRSRRQAAPRLGRSRMQGMGMIEVLVSVLVLAVGLLGIAAMQSLALRGGQSSLESSQAVMAANSIIEAMRANPTADYNIGKTCSAAAITGADVRANDLTAWINAMKTTIGSGVADTTTCGEIVGCPANCQVRVYWDDSRTDSRGGADQGGAARMVETRARI